MNSQGFGVATLNEQPALACHDIKVVFPLITPADAWRLLFSQPVEKYITALDRVSLNVPHRKIVGIIGKNGAGKSTLLRALAGIYSLVSGSVESSGDISSLFELGG